MLRCTPQAWNPAPASPRQATRRSHHRASHRSQFLRAIRGVQQQRAAGRRDRHRSEHRRVVEGAAKMQQPRFGRGAQQSQATDRAHQTPGWQAKHACAMRRIVPHRFGRAAQQASKQNGHRGTQWCAIEQVLPRRRTRTLEHIVEVEARAQQAGECACTIDCLPRAMCHRSLVCGAMSADAQGQRRDEQRNEHHRIVERAAVVFDGAVQQNRRRKHACRTIEPARRTQRGTIPRGGAGKRRRETIEFVPTSHACRLSMHDRVRRAHLNRVRAEPKPIPPWRCRPAHSLHRDRPSPAPR